jgi:predicted PurR-regulated permease PerM
LLRAIIVLGIVGGISVLGFPGLFFGPIVLGSLRATLDVYRREHLQDSPTASS